MFVLYIKSGPIEIGMHWSKASDCRYFDHRCFWRHRTSTDQLLGLMFCRRDKKYQYLKFVKILLRKRLYTMLSVQMMGQISLKLFYSCGALRESQAWSMVFSPRPQCCPPMLNCRKRNSRIAITSLDKHNRAMFFSINRQVIVKPLPTTSSENFVSPFCNIIGTKYFKPWSSAQIRVWLCFVEPGLHKKEFERH